jgi:hypothetical protein
MHCLPSDFESGDCTKFLNGFWGKLSGSIGFIVKLIECGLQIFPGRAGGQAVVAAPWTPAESLGENGWVRQEFIWAVLDCPGAFAVQETMERAIVLGRLTAKIRQAVKVKKPYTVIGWAIGRDGRKHYAGTALYDSAGRLCALAKAVWIGLVE